ncbi:MAG: magnesium transporter [Victivallaceae bacterium]|nr:magnesium transporter [Victivallaceae bacterium]
MAHLDKKNIQQLLDAKKFDELRFQFSCTDPADVADALDELDSSELELVFSILDNEAASEVLSEMDSDEIEDVLESLPPARLAKVMEEMAPDDAADLFNELDIQEQNKILHFLDPVKKKEIQELAHYEEDSAGGLMTPEFCAVSSEATVQQAIGALVEADYSDPITSVFVVDQEGHLVGDINISELISKAGKSLVKEVIDPDPVFAFVDEDQVEVAHKVRKYDLLVIPVVDHNKKLIGRITVDDIIDVIDEEASEDMARMAGAPDIEHNESSPLSIVRLRLPWLLITMVTGTLVSFVIQKITSIERAVCLVAFIPVILGMGGNTGMQATAVTIRSIALGEIKFSRLAGIFRREMFVGAMMGTVCSIIVAGVVWINLMYFSKFDPEISLLRLIAVVGCSMFSAMTFAALTGTVFPIVLHRFNIDPAVASGPFVSTGNDLSASLIYLVMCYLMLTI